MRSFSFSSHRERILIPFSLICLFFFLDFSVMEHSIIDLVKRVVETLKFLFLIYTRTDREKERE